MDALGVYYGLCGVSVAIVLIIAVGYYVLDRKN